MTTLLNFSSSKYVKGQPQPLSFNKETNSFTVEISEMSQICEVPVITNKIAILDIDRNKELVFFQTKIDKDGSGEDIYGWNYKANNGAKLLIIND